MAEFVNEYREAVRERSILKIRQMLETMPDYVRAYIRGISQNHMETTQLAYLVDIRTFLEWLVRANPALESRQTDPSDLSVVTLSVLESLKAEDFEEYLTSLDLYEDELETGKVKRKNGVRSKRRKFSALRSFYDYLFKNDKIALNPILKVAMPDSRALKRHHVTALEANETAALVDAVESGASLSKGAASHHEKYRYRDLAIVTLMLSTGIRVSECVGLDFDHIDLEEMKMTVVRKGGFSDEVYFNEETLTALRDYLENDRLKTTAKEGSERALFLSNRRQRIAVRTIEELVAKYAKGTISGKHVKVHSLRSSLASSLINEDGVPLTTVKDILGHASVQTTQMYVEESKLGKRRAAQGRKLRG